MSHRVSRGTALLAFALLFPVVLPAQTGDGASRYATLNGARIHYQSWGKGTEALVLVHGWSQSLDSWRDNIPELAQRNRVVALDLPGHGASDKPQVAYSMAYFAGAVRAVMRAAGVQRAVLAGHSMGTPVVRQFYRKYPAQTLALIIVDGPLEPFGDPKMLQGLITGLKSPGYKEVGGAMLAQLTGPNLPPEVLGRVRTQMQATPQHVLASAMEGLADSTIWTRDQIKVPVLAILAKRPQYPPDLEQRMRLIGPKLEFVIWDDVGHFLMMEQPKRFDQVVLGFLDKNGLLKR